MKWLLTFFVLFATWLQGYSYKGCYADRQQRDLNGYSFSSEAMELGDCATLCKKKGYRYMGLQYSSYCFCGNDFGKYGQAQNCNMPCSGQKDKTCGGSWANSVYDLTDGASYLHDYFHNDVNVEPWFERWEVTAVPLDAKKLVGPIPRTNQRFGWKHPVVAYGDAMPPDGANGAALYLHPVSQQKPAVLKTSLLVTRNNDLMKIRIAGNRNADFILKVKIDGKTVLSQSVDGQKWHNYSVSLAPYLAQNVEVEVDIAASGWYFEYAFIDEIRFY